MRHWHLVWECQRVSPSTRVPPLRALTVPDRFSCYSDIYFVFAWRIRPMFLKAHLTIPYAYLNHPYQTSCGLLLWFILFCFPSLPNVFMCIYPICSVPRAKWQVWDPSQAGAAVLLLVSDKTEVMGWACNSSSNDSMCWTFWGRHREIRVHGPSEVGINLNLPLGN